MFGFFIFNLLKWKFWGWGFVIYVLIKFVGCLLNLRIFVYKDVMEKVDLEENYFNRIVKLKVRLEIVSDTVYTLLVICMCICV